MVLSLVIYFAVFIISSYACYCYEKIEDSTALATRNKRLHGFILNLYKTDFLKMLCVFFIIAPPVFLYTFRDLSVGTDNAQYLVIYDTIKSYNIFDYISIYKTLGSMACELGYQQIQYVAYVTGGGYNLVKFICSFLVIFFLWRGILYYHRKFNIDSGLCMFFFYLFEFSYGLNAVRYAIGLSLFFYSVQFIIEKKFINYLLCCIAMCLFHISMISVLPFYLINFTGYKILRKYWAYIAIIFVIVSLVSLRFLVSSLLPNIAAVIDKLNSYKISTDANYGMGALFISGLYLFPLLRWNSFVKKNVEWTCILIVALTYIPLRYLGYFNQWLGRLTNIPVIIFCILYCGAMKLPVTFSEKLFWKTYTILIAVVIYVYSIVIVKNSDVYPLIFDFTNHV